MVTILSTPRSPSQADDPTDEVGVLLADDRVQRPGRAVQGGDAQPTRSECFAERLPRAGILEQFPDAHVGR